ncbi:hypothetical protein DFH11DRAFT_1486017, partial [Phellopilus nigrolimitatus]
AVMTLFHLLMRNDKGCDLRQASPTKHIMNLVATVVVFGAVIYLQGFRLEIPVKSNRFHGRHGSY